MNKFKILNTIKNRGKKILITCVPCIIILLVILILCFYGYYDSYDNEMIGYIVIFMPSFIFFVIYSYVGFNYYVNTEKVARKKGYGNILDMSEDFYGKIEYKDDYIRVSPKVIATDGYDMAYRWDVYLITFHTVMSCTYGQYTPTKFFSLHTRDKRYVLHVNLKPPYSDQEYENVLKTLLKYCPNAVYGELDGAGGNHLAQMRNTDIHDIPNSPYYITKD